MNIREHEYQKNNEDDDSKRNYETSQDDKST